MKGIKKKLNDFGMGVLQGIYYLGVIMIIMVWVAVFMLFGAVIVALFRGVRW
jgi:hypothetical protein